MNNELQNEVIRISKEEATSSHVDDLLKRQMSLRGEPGVTRDRGKKWYYQNWFVLMLVGGLGAFLAWALIEPYFDDHIYLQGVIQSVEVDNEKVDFATLKIQNEAVYVLPTSREIDKNGKKHRVDLDTLRTGETVGVYLSDVEEGGRHEDVEVVSFLVRNPRPQAGGAGAVNLESLQNQRRVSSLVLFPLVAGLIGLFIGATDGLVCRLPRRALLCGAVGLVVGLVGGFVCDIAAGIVYGPLSDLAMRQSKDPTLGLSTLGFVIQVFGRALAWAMVGVATGLGQGIALRSKRLLIYGLLGGVVGGLLGGMLFDPIDQILLGPDKPSAHWSRMIGLTVIGLSVGAMIGIVELLARDTWLRMTQGPLSGKEFILFKDVMNVGSSPRSDVYLFNDPQVAADHAVIRTVGDECEVEARHTTHPVLLNSNAVRRARLRHGDTVTIGRTIFVFQRRRG
jgi:hypothetical protein